MEGRISFFYYSHDKSSCGSSQSHLEDESPMQPFLHSDGEACVMNEAFSEEVMSAFEDASINYLKGGPSHTSMTQDLDCYHMFSSLKAGVKHVHKYGTHVRNGMLREGMLQAMSEFEREYSIDISPLRNKIIYGHEVITYSAQKHWTAHKMKESSKVVGIHTELQQDDDTTVNFNRVMTRTYNHTATAEELTHMINCKDEVANHFIEKGKLLLLKQIL